MKKILTIIIPTYNMEKYLRRCLDSLIVDAEKMAQLEVLVVNDGSKDSSSAIAHEYATKYPQTFRVIDKENGNYGSCVNRGLKEANGKYVKILDADDCYYTENLSDFLGVLKNSVADIVFSPFDIYNSDSILVKQMKASDNPDGKVLAISDIQWSQPIESCYRAMHSMAVLTQKLIENKYYQTEGISYTDVEFVFFSILYADKCSFFSRPIYKYYLGRDGQTMNRKSMIKSHMHLYQNTKVMMDTYKTLPNTIKENKRFLLFTCIGSTFSYYITLVLGYIKHPTQQLILAESILVDAMKCKLYCPLYEYALHEKTFMLWKKFHFLPIVIYYLMRINNWAYKLNIKNEL